MDYFTFEEAMQRRRREVDRFAAERRMDLSDDQRHWLAAAVPLVGEPFEAAAKNIPAWYWQSLGIEVAKESSTVCVSM